jgi:hypothetical protein
VKTKASIALLKATTDKTHQMTGQMSQLGRYQMTDRRHSHKIKKSDALTRPYIAARQFKPY